ncbi:Os01g0745300, partial [Oryza sativa Japonica Group]
PAPPPLELLAGATDPPALTPTNAGQLDPAPPAPYSPEYSTYEPCRHVWRSCSPLRCCRRTCGSPPLPAAPALALPPQHPLLCPTRRSNGDTRLPAMSPGQPDPAPPHPWQLLRRDDGQGPRCPPQVNTEVR